MWFFKIICMSINNIICIYLYVNIITHLYSVNKIGPKTEPCETPIVQSMCEDLVPLAHTHYFLF